MIVYDPKRTVPNWAPGSWEYLETLLTRRSFCFEWGGGQSTRWLADRAGFVLTVENSLEWARLVLKLTKSCDNCQLILADRLTRRYVEAMTDLIMGFGKLGYNVYLIDGYQRINCLKKAKTWWKPGDIVVLDDALDYTEGIELPGEPRVFRMPHPYAGKPVEPSDKGNTTLKVHAEFKETWISVVT